MEDDELASIRQARMAQLRQQGASSASAAGGPSSSFLSSIGASQAPHRRSAGGGGGGGGDDDDDDQRGVEQVRMEEQKRQILTTILDNEARERLSRISLVKPQKAQGITNLIIQMAQQGQIRQKVNEAQLIGLLEQVEKAQGDGSVGGGGGGVGKIVYNRKKISLDDDDDDFDL